MGIPVNYTVHPAAANNISMIQGQERTPNENLFNDDLFRFNLSSNVLPLFPVCTSKKLVDDLFSFIKSPAIVGQLDEVIETIRSNPNSRRIIISCHDPLIPDVVAHGYCLLFQFHVCNDTLTCTVFGGLCNKTPQYAITVLSFLTILVAHVTGLTAEEIVYCDVSTSKHVYEGHKVESFLKTKVEILKKITNIEELRDDDLRLVMDNSYKLDEKIHQITYNSGGTEPNNELEKTGEIIDEHEERLYLSLLKRIIDIGKKRSDRTGTGTQSIFGARMKFNLRDGIIPVFTTKRVFWRGVLEELLWFIKGSTNANELSDKKVHIWDANGCRKFLDDLGFTLREEGDLGPVYGFQWRHRGAEYYDMRQDYAGKGMDQLKKVIQQIKTNPGDLKRCVVNAWNPQDIAKMALPPCHVMFQFHVSNGELSCCMYQRSADMGLGVPFNVASYSLLTHMVAHVTGLKAGDFIHCIGDAHVYLNHVEPLMEQLERTPRSFPKLRIKKETDDIDLFVSEDFELIGYKPHPTIKMEMAV